MHVGVPFFHRRAEYNLDRALGAHGSDSQAKFTSPGKCFEAVKSYVPPNALRAMTVTFGTVASSLRELGSTPQPDLDIKTGKENNPLFVGMMDCKMGRRNELFAEKEGRDSYRNGAPLLNAEVPCPAILAGFPVQVFLVTDGLDYHLATPLLATPGKALGETIDLIVVATGKRALSHWRKNRRLPSDLAQLT